MGEAPTEIQRNGKTFDRDYRAECVRTTPPSMSQLVPVDALGCNPSQIAQQEAYFRKIGAPVEGHTAEGAPLIRGDDTKTLKKLCDHYGMVSKSGRWSPGVSQV